jgi:transcriptional regulator with XRE-family HTH domain
LTEKKGVLMVKKTNNYIGLRIKEMRERLDYNQAKLASEAKITPAAICQIEAGDRIPSTPILRKLASVLRVSTDYLLGNTDEPELRDLLQDENVQKFFRGFQNLSPNDQEFIQRQIDLIKGQNKT